MNPCKLIPLALTVCLTQVPAQTPGSYQVFGKSCGSGAVPPLLTAPKLPVIGRELVISVRHVLPGQLGLLVVGASNTQWSGSKLPLSMASIGAMGCDLNVSLDVSLPVVTGMGTAHFLTRLPKDQGLVGLTFYNQFISPDPKANTAGISFSNGGKAIIGSCLCLPVERIVEDFANAAMLDRDRSSGTWSGGRALAARVGGTGRHGVFDYKLGRLVGTTYEWSSDKMVIPATHTESGRAETVTDGVFEFSSMHLPAGVTLRFVGSNPVQIKVRAVARIDGSILVSAMDAPYFSAVPNAAYGPIAAGQASSAGGPGGGAGGAGGDGSRNQGASVAFNGKSGSDVRLRNGHGYAAQAVGTGGKGSRAFPISGVITAYCALNSQFASETVPGGGGGGFHFQGGVGGVTRNPCNQARYSGPAPAAAKAYALGSFAPLPGLDGSLIHYAVGGSGGGGGGSHPLISRAASPHWCPGSTGAGGGGVLALRIGRELRMASGATIEAKGGSGYLIDGVQRAGESNDSLFNMPSPGGGGSGGSVLLQVGESVTMNGMLDTSGGAAGSLDNTGVRQSSLLAKSSAGAGQAGFVRIETIPGLNIGQAGVTIPAAASHNVGKLLDHDRKVTSQSRVYNTGLGFSPYFLRYEIEADLAGRKVLYSDDPTLTDPRFIGPAAAGQQIQFRVQGQRLDQRTNTVLWQGPWRDNVRLGRANTMSSDDVNSWRFQLVYDRSASTDLVVTRVTIWFQR